MKLLFVGDVVGGVGRRTLRALLPELREEHAPDFVVVNGENAAGGVGITPADRRRAVRGRRRRHHARQPHLPPSRGVAATSTSATRSCARQLPRRSSRATAAAWSSATASGSAWCPCRATCSCGRAAPAFTEVDAQLERLEGRVDHVLVDMHAEATSEKVAMGWYLDGRVTAVVGTHTHVPTADARVLPGGTAYITDVGMTGPRGGVIGVKREQAIEALVTQLPVQFETSRGGPVADGRADHRVAADASRRDRAGPASRASVSAERREQHRVARRHEQDHRRALVHQRRVARRELELGQHAPRRPAASASSRSPRVQASAANGTSQTRNCGESTFPRATNASSAASEPQQQRVLAGRAARDQRDHERQDADEQRPRSTRLHARRPRRPRGRWTCTRPARCGPPVTRDPPSAKSTLAGVDSICTGRSSWKR